MSDLTKNLIQSQPNGFYYIRFPNLGRFSAIQHAVITRRGGVSQGCYTSMNLSYHAGDKNRHVNQNRQQLANHFQPARLIYIHQVHGAEVIVIKSRADLEKASGSIVHPLPGDAVITNRPGVALVILVADCQPIMLYDPHRQVIANIHSGWRGSVSNIIGATVASMARQFECRAQDLIAAIGPSLGPCCAQFVNYRKELPQAFWKYRRQINHFDFWSISKSQLLTCGVKSDHIYLSRICTYCHPEHFYSYRKERITGRFAAVIGLRMKNDRKS